jgi:8-oxo-dGTP pyrophosphatase MutT (NUDIX family)
VAGAAPPPDFVGVYGWLEEEGRVLVVATRRDLGAAGRQICWELPGGKVEPGERDEDALRREIREETGLEVEVGAMFFSFRGERTSGGRRRYGWEGKFFHLRRLGGSLGSDDEETVGVRMAPLGELAELFTAEYHKPILKWLQSGRTLREDSLRWEDSPAGA